MFPILDVPSARQTILRRLATDEMPIPPSMLERIAATFGERIRPDEAVSRILADVRQRGDAALRDWSQRLDRVAPETFRVPPNELQAALESLPELERIALQEAAERVNAFFQGQPLTSWLTQSLGGTLGQIIRPIHRVGLYVPAGTAPLPSTVIMTAVPAQVAGVDEIVLVAPPYHDTGKIAPVILAAAALVGVREVYTLGGAQAIAALAYGTESIPRVDKIFGPGNLFVTLAKKQVFGSVGIDSLAGPTETVVVADETARPEWVAADLLAQAEHDVMASAILLTPSRTLAEAARAEILRQLPQLSRAEIITNALTQRSGAVITRDLDEALELANTYAPEHLCLSVADPWHWTEKVTCAGGVFLGEHSFEVLGDYIAGPSHVMPTNGTARFTSALNVWDFVKVVSLIALDAPTARRIGGQAATIALSEGLDAHASAARKRL